MIAERYDAVGEFLAAHPEGADPTVARLIGAARDLPAHQLAGDLDRVRRHAAALAPTWDEVDVVVVPTVGEAPTLAEVAADPIGVNARLGRFTNGCNILDLCAAAVPGATRADGMPFGVTFLAPAFADAVWPRPPRRGCWASPTLPHPGPARRRSSWSAPTSAASP